LELVLTCYLKQLNFGVSEDVLELVEIPGVKKARAKRLWKAGYKTVKDVAGAKEEDMHKVTNFGPYNAGICRRIIAAAKVLLEAKAQKLQEEANMLLKN